ncbi:PstS family phosphate ABC transporter substrate-binding protein [Bacillus timonensis]|nr:PstS family phosphate ABC transporter substrate-binding protein [Bacillus timonensis]
MKSLKFLGMSLMISSVLAFTAACGNAGNEKAEGQLQGEIPIDGSSTVYPIMEAAAEDYRSVQPDVKVSVGFAGTGGGMEKFTKGETDFSNASREIKDEEAQAAADNGIEFERFELAYDGITVVVNPQNDWAQDITVEELKKMWIEDGTTKKWSDIRADWPAEEIVFYSPGHDSGTYDYFDEVILDEQELVRNATLNEDDNVLVQGVAGDKYAIGFFGYAYYSENLDKVRALAVNGVEPTNETIETGTYTPLSRPLYTYVNTARINEKPEVYDFLTFLMENAGDLAEDVGYVRLPQEKYEEQLAKLDGLKK